MFLPLLLTVNARFSFRPTICALTALMAVNLGSYASAQSVATTPVGAVTVTVAASFDGVTYNTTQISAPLHATPLVPGDGVSPVSPSGALIGKITSVGAATIEMSTAGWTSGQLSQPAYPIFVKITSGANQGRCFHITANTENTLTVNNQNTDLTTLTFMTGANGDTFELLAGDTLLGFLGTPSNGVVGGTASQFSGNQVDKVTLNNITNNVLFTYYYNTDFGQWRRSGSSTNQNNVVIAPDTGISYQRVANTDLVITLVGAVPTSRVRSIVPTLGTTVLARYFPTDATLVDLGIHNLPNWRKVGVGDVTIATSDRVLIKNGLTIFSYYYDGLSSQWKRSGSGSNQGAVVVGAGSAVRIQRGGAVGSFDTWTVDANYNLN